MSVIERIPVVAGLAYIEHVRRQPSAFVATLVAEPGNRYFPQAIAVTAGGDKLGYVAPEVARRYFDPISAAGPSPVTCPARRGPVSDHETSGVELLLDFSTLPVAFED
jgi:hypothetical protein